MKPSCPRCQKADFSYRALLAVHPAAGESIPYRIVCPCCGIALRITAKSRVLAGAGVIGSLAGCLLALGLLQIQLTKWQVIAVAMATLATYYFAFWPLVVRFKPWSPFQYWLPKSRLIGYAVYLLTPVVAIVLILALAIRLGA